MKYKTAGFLVITVMLFVFNCVTAFTQESELKDFIGKKICREAQGPDDTASFKIVLLKDGKVKGSGSFSGATANYKLTSGTWVVTDDKVEINLIFSGKKYGEGKDGKGTQAIKIRIPKSDLLTFKSGCFEFTDAL